MVWSKSVTQAFIDWLESENGKLVRNTPFGKSAHDAILVNRMARSFEAGADAGQKLLVQYLSQHYRDELENLIT